MKVLSSCIAGIFFAAIPIQAIGATMNYYFAGAPFVIANHPGGSGPLMRTGSLTIDLAALPGGSPAGQRVASQLDFGGFDEEHGWYPLETTPGFVSATMDRERSSPAGHSLRTEVAFDDAGRIAAWSIEHEGHDAYCFANCLRVSGDARTGQGQDARFGMYGENDFFYTEEERRAFLTGLGYREGTPAYRAYFEDEDLWYYETLAADQGQWFDNLFDFSRQVEANTALALANPARSIYQIAPIPLPAPLMLVLAGIAALAGVSRRRAVG
jgi:hypothetical protein